MKSNQSIHTSTNPWKWIPTLYIAEGLPYFAVNTLTVLMYNNLGLSKSEMAFYTGWLYLPWVIKPFWSPFVDIMRTKRWWTIAMQLLICVCMAGVALSLPTSLFLGASLGMFWIMAFSSATHDISADGLYILALDEKKQASFVGVRSTFYRIASVLGQGGIVILAGTLEERILNIPLAWSITFGILSIFFFLLFLYHCYSLPYPKDDMPSKDYGIVEIANGFIHSFVTFFKKKYVWTAVVFMLLYRLPEALCIKLVQPFLKDSIAEGGLALSTAHIGIINGTIGVISLLAGGILGGVLISKGGLKRWLMPMAMALTLPCLVYCYLSYVQPPSFVLISVLIGFEQFGYGFGFTSFMLYMMYFSKGENATSHYSFCTAFMALGMMIPGMFAGWLFDNLPEISILSEMNLKSYEIFFWFVILTSVITFYVTFLVYRSLPKAGIRDAD